MTQKGYVAISSIVVIAAVVIVVGITVSLVSINEAQVAFSGRKSEEVLNIVEACIEDALYKLSGTNTLPSTITLPQGTCSVITDAHIGNSWTFTTIATVSSHAKAVQVQATNSATISIGQWKEIQ
ncbi:MAG TPA: hypothetical protein VJ246_00610 [Patescibacteria group bacterium]|nr:hypothetical protein [Patescibacteria group bacterium]